MCTEFITPYIERNDVCRFLYVRCCLIRHEKAGKQTIGQYLFHSFTTKQERQLQTQTESRVSVAEQLELIGNDGYRVVLTNLLVLLQTVGAYIKGEDTNFCFS